MLSLSILFIFLSTQIHCQNITVKFPTISTTADLATCTCDLTVGHCDTLCCCDNDCTAEDKQVFSCSSRLSQYTNSSPVYSSIQANCFKNLSIFYSDTPYVVEKAGELVCIDYTRSTLSQFYQQPTNDNLDPAVFVRLINAQDNVNAPSSIPTGFTSYQVGTPILRAGSTTNSRFFSLPIPLLRNGVCSGSQAITYMTDFTSTCSQFVTNEACALPDGLLNPARFNNLCLQPNPSGSGSVCYSGSISNSTFGAASGCTNALKSIIITITYSNPTGITGINVATTIQTALANQPFEQNYFVRFVKASTTQNNATKNPGYVLGANIVAGYSSSNQISVLSSSRVSLLKGSTSGVCDNTSSRLEIRFGENLRSNCLFDASTTTACASATLPLLTNFYNLAGYFAAYSVYDPTNITSDWLPVISCTSAIGSPDSAECVAGPISIRTTDLCYVRLDIQIAFTKIGSYLNPQSILSAVIFNYQTEVITSRTDPIYLSSSLTFTELNNTPVVEVGIIPPPDTRLPADFFYPFTSGATTNVFSSLFVFVLFFLVYKSLSS